MTTTKAAASATAVEPTAWDKRLAETKGFVEYNPAESFVIHVQWVVANPACAHEMLQALAKCARATLRDAPPVLCYCFRISHDQRLAVALKNRVQTAGDHPQLAKKFKMADMNMPLSVIAAMCDREGISSVPFRQAEDEGQDGGGGCWTKDTPMTPERAALLGFDPVVLDCTEIYLDNRAFSNHALSKDYLNAYATLMQPFRSLEVHAVVSGTPTIGIWNRVLEPMLHARRAQEPEPERLSLQPHVFADFAAASMTTSSSCDYLHLDVNVTTVQVAEDLIASIPNSPYHCLFQLPESSSTVGGGVGGGYRLIMPVAVADVDKIRDVLVAGQAAAVDESAAAALVCGRIMLYCKNPTTDDSYSLVKKMGQTAQAMLQEMFAQHPGIEIGLVVDDNASITVSSPNRGCYAGYGLMTEKLAELVPDATVECKDYDKE
jgi:hypothetical protein